MDERANLDSYGPSAAPVKIICLHGGPGMDHSYFNPFLLPLADPVELIMYTQGWKGTYDIATLVEELHEVVGAYSKGKVILLGHDFGGELALQYLHDKGQDGIAGLILVSWYYSRGWSRHVRRRRGQQIEGLEKEMDAAVQGLSDPNEVLQERTAHLAPLHFTPGALAKGLKVLRSIQYNAELAKRLNEDYVEKTDQSEFIKALKIPTLSLVGAQDGIVDPDYVKKGAGMNLKILSGELKNSAHFPFIDEQGQFIQMVQRFVLSIHPEFAKKG
jgi:proline iminopeptidase